LAGFTTIEFGTKVLTVSVPVVGKKKFLAVQAFAAASLRRHRGSKSKEPVSDNCDRNDEENPAGRRLRREKKEQESLVNLPKKTQAKKIHLLTARFASIRFRPPQERVVSLSTQFRGRGTLT
jgi:hypothetical protein